MLTGNKMVYIVDWALMCYSDILKCQYKMVTLCTLLSGIEDACEVAYVTTKCWYDTDPKVSHWS